MNIMFLGPPVEKKKVPIEYKTIIDVAKKMKHHLMVDHLFKTSSKPKKDQPKLMEQRYKKILSEMKGADMVIAEGTTITAEMSRLISIALQQHIPTLILYKQNNPEVYVFESSRLLMVKKYTVTTLPELVQNYLTQGTKQKLLYRFNLMLSKEIDLFVMDRAKEQQLSKADYIRKLIVKEMDKSTS